MGSSKRLGRAGLSRRARADCDHWRSVGIGPGRRSHANFAKQRSAASNHKHRASCERNSNALVVQWAGGDESQPQARNFADDRNPVGIWVLSGLVGDERIRARSRSGTSSEVSDRRGKAPARGTGLGPYPGSLRMPIDRPGWWGVAMTSTDSSAGRENASEAVSSDPVHDFAWHRRHRSRRSVRLVDMAIIAGWGAFAGWILLHH
jgi:hypothetical protein